MSCLLRVSSKELSVDNIVRDMNLSPSTVWHFGERRDFPGITDRHHRTSGFTIEVSKGSMRDLASRIADATEFLKVNRVTLLAVSAYQGVEELDLDFALVWPAEKVMMTDLIPFEFIAALHEFRIDIMLSHYQSVNEVE